MLRCFQLSLTELTQSISRSVEHCIFPLQTLMSRINLLYWYKDKVVYSWLSFSKEKTKRKQNNYKVRDQFKSNRSAYLVHAQVDHCKCRGSKWCSVYKRLFLSNTRLKLLSERIADQLTPRPFASFHISYQ